MEYGEARGSKELEGVKGRLKSWSHHLSYERTQHPRVEAPQSLRGEGLPYAVERAGVEAPRRGLQPCLGRVEGVPHHHHRHSSGHASDVVDQRPLHPRESCELTGRRGTAGAARTDTVCVRQPHLASVGYEVDVDSASSL